MYLCGSNKSVFGFFFLGGSGYFIKIYFQIGLIQPTKNENKEFSTQFLFLLKSYLFKKMNNEHIINVY